MMSQLLIPKLIQAKQTWSQLYGCSLPLALAEYSRQNLGVKLFITPDNLSAQQLMTDLQFFLTADQEILLFPDWEILPFDHFSPHHDIISERLYTLNRLQHTKNAIVISAVSTIMHRVCPPTFLNHAVFSLQVGQKLDLDPFKYRLQDSGYNCVHKVLEHGEFAVRGSLFDIYPMGSKLPFRIELFDDLIESLRYFDPDTQRTIEKISQIQIFPAREFPLNERSIAQFRRTFREQFSGNPSLCPLYEAISKGKYLGGVEYYLPLFFENTATLFDYLPDKTAIVLIEQTQEHAQNFWQELTTRFEQRRYDISRPILSPERCCLTPIELMTKINQYQQIRIYHQPVQKKGSTHLFATQQAPSLPIDRHAAIPLFKFATYLSNSARRYLFVVESAGRREVLMDLLKQSQIFPTLQDNWHTFLQDTARINITIGPLNEGAELLDSAISILVEAQFFWRQTDFSAQRTT